MKYFIAKEFKSKVAIIIILTICLWIRTYSDIFFNIGKHKINLNDGLPVVKELNFAPGKSILKEFFIENNSDESINFQLFFSKVNGKLEDILEVSIKDGEDVLIKGSIKDFNKQCSLQRLDTLKAHEKKIYTIEFYFPKETGNEYQNTFLEFDIKAREV